MARHRTIERVDGDFRRGPGIGDVIGRLHPGRRRFQRQQRAIPLARALDGEESRDWDQHRDIGVVGREEELPELLVVDYKMPGITGAEVLDVLRKELFLA